MTTVKTYQKINAKEQGVGFGISKMEDIYTRRNGKVDEAHRHNYYTVLVVKKAKGLHKIDFSSYDLSARQIYFVAPGQVHQVIEKEKSEGYAMTFSNDFLMQNSVPLSFISGLSFVSKLWSESTFIALKKKDLKPSLVIPIASFSLFHGDDKMKDLSVGAYLKLLLIQCNNICEIDPMESDINSSDDGLVRSFKAEVDKHYREEHSTNFYAKRLHISADHLNRAIKSKIGKTTKEYIQSRIITEAKRLLYFTAMSNKEIGYELGFNEPANFSAFFKKTHATVSNKL